MELCLWFRVLVILVVYSVGLASAQLEPTCYGPGSIATTVILTIIIFLLLAGAAIFFLKKYRARKVTAEKLIVDTDPEKGKDYAFDNPAFKDTNILPIAKTIEAKLEEGKSKWNQWSPLGALSKPEKKKTVDDLAIESKEVKVVALSSHDFTGLGFNICGNMKEGIYIKDILHRGPAFESGKLSSGDRINSVTISFEHMVYEDALTILSYASPYEVIIEAKGGRLIHNTPGQGGEPHHPVYRSSSCTDFFHTEKISKKLFSDDHSEPSSSNYSSLQKSKRNITTQEKKESPLSQQTPNKLTPSKHLSSDQLKTHLEQRIMDDHQNNLKTKEKPQRVQVETQKTENKYQKFGIRVLPLDQQKSPKSSEQNENNLNIEKKLDARLSVDEVVEILTEKKEPMQIKKRDKKPEIIQDSFDRNSLNGSGIKRDKNGIPQEIPNHMFNAAVAARKNRKTPEDKGVAKEEIFKRKGKAPSPPEDAKSIMSSKNNYDEIQITTKDNYLAVKLVEETIKDVSLDNISSNKETKGYNSDSDIETDNQSSVNTIELNSSDITIHQTEDEERQNRRTASTGDLSKIQKNKKVNTGTLERAQSLDITDTGMTSLKRKGGRIEDNIMNSEKDLFRTAMISKDPRLSLILDGLNTFQRNRLKKSTEWENLEDAILKLNQDDDSITSFEDRTIFDSNKFNFGGKSPEFNALVNKINEIKGESIKIPSEVVENYKKENKKTEKKVRNQIWPFDNNLRTTSFDSSRDFNIEINKINADLPKEKYNNSPLSINSFERRQQVPVVQQRNYQSSPPLSPSVSPPLLEEVSLTSPEKQPLESTLELFLTDSTAHKRQVIKSAGATFDISTTETLDLISDNESLDKHNQRPRTPPKEDLSLINTSPPVSLEIDELPIKNKGNMLEKTDPELLQTSTTAQNRSEQVLSKIPLLNSMVQNQKEEQRILSTNSTDESKTVATFSQPNLLDVTENFLYTEQLTCSQDEVKPYGINVPDDMKVSRHSSSALEESADLVPKSDDAKSEDTLRHISNVNVSNVSNGDSELHSLELSINEPSELYTTALDSTVKEPSKIDEKITVITPDLIKNAALPEPPSDVTVVNSKNVTMEQLRNVVEVTESKFSTVTETPSAVSIDLEAEKMSPQNSTLTYITEIQVVTPNNRATTNISETKIIPKLSAERKNGRNLESEFEDYVKNFESKLEKFENNIQEFDKNIEEFIKDEPTSIILDGEVDEKELHKIQEIAEEQFKKLPEMRFTTSSYEASRIPTEKRQSQIELLRSNFEKIPLKSKPEVGKSRIPIATTAKTPPTSPERRDSRNLDTENDKAILELMCSSVTSTPYTASKYQIKPPNKNVTVTSIRSGSKIPSGLPTLSSNRPPIAPRKTDTSEGNTVQVSTNGNPESSFKQWVFNPTNITSVVVKENKPSKT